MAFEERQHIKFYAFTKQLMGGAPRIYGCIQISQVENKNKINKAIINILLVSRPQVQCKLMQVGGDY